jgi:HlyD family secretion protein
MKEPLHTKPLAQAAKKRPLLAAVVILAILAIVIIAVRLGGGNQEPTTAYHEVKRGNLLISVVEGGSLQAVTEVSIRNMVEGTGRIIRIVPEGTFVKKGDLLVELDSSSAQDQVNQQEITVRRAELEFLQAQKQLEITASQTNSDYTAANIKLELARIDLQKFVEGELAQLERELELDVDTIREQLTIDEERYHYSTNLLAAGFETKSKADADRLTLLRTEKNLQQATNSLWMFKQFDRRKLQTNYESKVKEAEEDLDRVVKQSEARMAQAQADVETKTRTLALNESKLERDKQNLAAAKIFAPSDGLVVYATPEGRFSSESMIEEGATVRFRQEIIKLPDTSAMKLTIKVHESHVGKVRPGQAAYVVLDPQPDQRYEGRVSRVALLPNTQDRWSNPNLKVYDTEIMITGKLPEEVKPGVSARAEIVITNLTDVLTVPVQAVTTLKGKPVVYLAGARPTAVPVQVGLFNTRYIHIAEGLNEGARVLLSPPLDTEASDNIDGTILQEGEAGPTNAVSVARMETAPPAFGARANGDDGPSNGLTAPGGEAGSNGRAAFDPQAMLRQWDKDGDGQLSEEERAAMLQARGNRGGGGQGGERTGGGFNREAMLKQFDTDGDGQLSETEQAAMRAAFPRNRNRGGQEDSAAPRAPQPAGGDENP